MARSFEIREGKELEFQAQAFNLFNHPNYYVQNGLLRVLQISVRITF
ncbi:MAG: hypothetical protein ACLP56_09935 [Candidatus Sulfotelmatobacter sp.]